MALILTACAAPDGPDPTKPTDAVTVSDLPNGPCYVTDTTPALIETAIVQTEETPAVLNQDGSIKTPAVFQTRSNPRIIQERQEVAFETPCDGETNPEFIATLQRALKARGHLKGAVTGELDTRTRTAIRSYQADHGLNSDILSISSARELGLVAYQRKEG